MARELKSLTASVELKLRPNSIRSFSHCVKNCAIVKQLSPKLGRSANFLEDRSSELSAQRQRVLQTDLFVGRVEQALENVSASRNVDELRDKVKTLADKIAQLRRDLDPRAQRDRLGAAIDTVSAKIAGYARLLQLEHATKTFA